METAKKRKINKITFSIFLGLFLIMITIVVATSGGGDDKDKGTKVTEYEAYVISKHFVKARLVSPSTADFPFYYDAYQKFNDTNYVIQGHVDSQNGYGAIVRTKYITTLIYKGGKEGNWHDENNWLELNFKTLD